MKRQALSDPKLSALCKALGIRRYEAVGILETMWHLTSEHAKPGNIGQYTDQQIADWIGWPHDTASTLVGALVKTGWLDTNPQYRLLVHRWATHCQDYVHMALARSHTLFCTGEHPKLSKLSKDERSALNVHNAEYHLPTPCAQTPQNPCAQTESVRTSHRQSVRTDLCAQESSSPCALPLPLPLPCPTEVTSLVRTATTEVSLKPPTANGNENGGNGNRSHKTADLFGNSPAPRRKGACGSTSRPGRHLDTEDRLKSFQARFVNGKLLELLTNHKSYSVDVRTAGHLIKAMCGTGWSAFNLAQVLTAAKKTPRPANLTAYAMSVKEPSQAMLIEASEHLKILDLLVLDCWKQEQQDREE